MAEEKPFQASRKRLEKARRRGQVLKSQVLTQAIVLASGIGLLCSFGAYAWVRSKILLEYSWVNGFSCPFGCLVLWLRFLGGLSLAWVTGLALAGAISEAAQVRFCFEASLLTPKAERVSFIQGLRRSFTGLRQLGFWLLKLLFVVGGMLLWCKTWLGKLALDWEIRMNPEQVLRQVPGLLLACGGIFILRGLLNYLVLRRRFFRDLSMSLDEVRRELREEEGDPQVRAIRRAMHESLALQDFASRVKKAKVIVVERQLTPTGA